MVAAWAILLIKEDLKAYNLLTYFETIEVRIPEIRTLKSWP